MNISHLIKLALAGAAGVILLSGCGHETSSRGSNLASQQEMGTPDFYQITAAGADNCNDLLWLAEQCADAPGGAWGCGGAGVLGDPVASCNAAVNFRNMALHCW